MSVRPIQDGWGLVLDHSGRTARLGLGRAGGPLATAATEPSRRHRVDALAAADGLLSAAGIRPADLAWVGWVTGPGSFTGLRVAAATVQALRLARGADHSVLARGADRSVLARGADRSVLARSADPAAAPLRIAGVPATDALLAQHPDAVIALAVKRGTAWTAAADLPPALRSLDEVRRPGRPLLADPPHGDAPPEIDLATLFRLARERVAAGRFDTPEDLLPLYPREPEAVTLWNQRKEAAAREPRADRG